MGLLDIGQDFSAATTQMPDAFAGKQSAALAMNLPNLLSISSMLSFLGMDFGKYLDDFKVSKKDYKKNPLSVAKVGKNYYDLGALSEKKGEIGAQVDAKALSNAQAKYESLKQQPMLATLAAQAEGQFDKEFMQVVDKQVQDVVSKNLGVGTAQGFLNDPLKQATLTQPAAVAKAGYLQQVKQAAQGTLQGLAGLPQTVGFNPNVLLGPQTASAFLPSVFAAGQMGQQTQQFNAQMQWQAQQAQNQWKQDLFGMGASAAMFGLGGGFSNGGFWNPINQPGAK